MLATEGTIKRISKGKLHQELGLESLKKGGWYQKRYFYKIFIKQCPKYLLDIIPLSS